MSEATLGELADVLSRAKFDAYVPVRDRQEFLRRLGGVAEFVAPTLAVKACRDPKDDKFLSLAVSGLAKRIISGDRDLLDLHSFRGIAIQTPAGFVAEMGSL